MSIQHALLALLSDGPATTYDLRKKYDLAMGHVRPLNMGQASSTLSRLERDGKVQRDPTPTDNLSAGLWNLTAAGTAELNKWWAGALDRSHPERHDLVIKFAISATLPRVNISQLIQAQREATLNAMHDATRVRRTIDPGDRAAALVVDHHLFTLDAELRWLEGIEHTLSQDPHTGAPTSSPALSASSNTARQERLEKSPR